MYVFLNIFADLTKLVIGLFTVIVGFVILLAVSYGYAKLHLSNSGLDQTGWTVVLSQFALSIILMVAGSFIARR